MFITVSKTACHVVLRSAVSVQPPPYHTVYLRLMLSKGEFKWIEDAGLLYGPDLSESPVTSVI
jgi:hypothetical protein